MVLEATEDQVAEGLRTMDSELVYILSSKDVDQRIIGTMGFHGIRRVAVFAKLEATEELLRAWAIKDLGLNPEAGLGNMIKLAALLEAWVDAKERGDTQRKHTADLKARGETSELLRSEHLAMRKTFRDRHGETDEALFPATACVNEKVEQLEEGEFRAEALTRLYSLKLERARDMSAASGSLDLLPGGTLVMRQGKLVVPEPANPEELRVKITLLGNLSAFSAYRYPSSASLQGTTTSSGSPTQTGCWATRCSGWARRTATVWSGLWHGAASFATSARCGSWPRAVSTSRGQGWWRP